MASLEDELQDLKLKNNDLAQKVQYWKMLAAERADEKLELMKEINELRLKLSRLRNNGTVQANNLEAALQSAAQKALAHLVRASGEIATTMDLAKAYMQEREELNNAAPRWSSLGGTPSSVKKDKVHRVPPLMIGGQSIQPVVALTMLDTSMARSAVRSSSSNRNVTERAVPMHMLQDVYIPLTRIDLDLHTQNMETEHANNADDSSGQLQLNENEEGVTEESQRMEEEDFDLTRVLNSVTEDTEPEIEEETPPRSRTNGNRTDNPLEGPSWLLDANNDNQQSASRSRRNLEPDSTTELEYYRGSPLGDKRNNPGGSSEQSVARQSREFSPTVRRRKRPSSPPPAPTPRRASHYSPRPAPPRRMSNSGRVLKVVVAKMRLEEGAGSPAKRAALGAASHAPSPNGATVPGVIVSETSQVEDESFASGEPSPQHKRQHRQPLDTHDDHWTEDTHERGTNMDTRTHSREQNKQTIDDMELDTINMERRVTSKRRNERTNSRERSEQTNRERMEIQQSASRERIERSISRESNRQTDREHTEMERSESRELNIEQNERTNRNQRTNSRERNSHVNREQMEIQTGGRERNVKRRGNSADRSDRQRTEERSRSSERRDYRHNQSHSRERSHETRDDVRPDSRASSDWNLQDDTRGASVSRGGDSDSGSGGEREGRARRARRPVTYKEKPLNRKLRR